ncbi:N-6 DNA methylase [Paractinoplanes lichenicola]|uniref:N-6 DNA methylase n=1 Tax=Paractinoplanes lichenicola TaxID=2802976 RepID=A0ABS1VGN1_9ACTN|nr:DUF3696 domain-containing protein [Actinoplanes lichenicola]MBL7253862.1 N-6 DNA methylase [Actinoplanes lichenicola]
MTVKQLLDLARGIGVERGVDLILQALHARWTGSDPLPPAAGESDAYAAIVAAVDRVETDDIPDTFEAVLTGLTTSSKLVGEFHTPRSVAQLMAALVVRAGAVVYDPVCGTGSTLLAAHEQAEGVELVGTDIVERAASRTELRLQVHGLHARITAADAFEVAEHESAFADVVLAQPPWGVRLNDRQKARVVQSWGWDVAKGDMPWLYLAFEALRDGGHAAVVMPQNSMWGHRAAAYSELFDRDAVEAIIAVPGGVFRNISIKTAIWVLRRTGAAASRGRVLLVDAETLVRSAGRRDLEFPAEAVDQLAGLVRHFRSTGRVEAAGHVARVLARAELDPALGLVPQAYLAEPPEAAVTHPTPDRSLLTEVRLANFKSFGADTRVPLAPLTLVYGANSAGKSSVLQALLLLKQSIGQRGLVTQGPVADVGGFAGVVHRHTGESVGLGFTYGALPSWIPPGGTADPARLRDILWTFGEDGRGTLRRTRFGVDDLALSFSRSDPEDAGSLVVELGEAWPAVAGGGLLYPFETRGTEHEQEARRVAGALRRRGVTELALRSDGLLPTTETMLDRRAVAGLAEPDRRRLEAYAARLGRLAGGVSTEIRALLDSVVWLGPLRSAPRRFYDRSSEAGSSGDGGHVAMFLFDNATAADQVNEWLERMGVPYSLAVLPLGTGGGLSVVGDLVAVVLTDRRTGVGITPADVGFGISQILPIIVESLARQESIILVEQPETHLHPRLQAELADLFIEATRPGGRGNQLIVETHSEHLILRTQRRIREGAVDAAHVSVVYVDQDERGRTTARRLRLNDKGDFLDDWPHGFFDERLDELFGGL